MTTPNQAREAIYARAITTFAAVSPAVPYIFDNESGEHPDAAAGANSWARLTMRETRSEQETLGPIGARRYQRRGAFIMMLYALPDKGAQRADTIVKAFRDAFEGVSFSGVYFTDCQVIELGNEGAWWRVNALASFWFDETK